MLEVRENLPVFTKRNEILCAVQNNQVIVLSGETGKKHSTKNMVFNYFY